MAQVICVFGGSKQYCELATEWGGGLGGGSGLTFFMHAEGVITVVPFLGTFCCQLQNGPAQANSAFFLIPAIENSMAGRPRPSRFWVRQGKQNVPQSGTKSDGNFQFFGGAWLELPVQSSHPMMAGDGPTWLGQIF